ncbi:MAG: glycosyltransferase [Betaproteobacteria bacterium]|nr:glycosyltransferase [Betaproteobacteria bacterium]
MTASPRAPHIAVVLPVHDGENYLAEAIRSVLAQTLADFELIVIDDGSTDRTGAILSAFSDSRLRVIRFAENRGLVEALNCGIRASRSELIARMDADDVCLPRRFERQAAFLIAHPEIDLCGTWTRVFGNCPGVRRQPVEPAQVRAHMFFGGAIDHPSLMMRRAFVERNGLAYNDDHRYAEDLDFLIRAADFGKLSNVPEILLRYRMHGRQVSVVRKQEQLDAHRRLLVRQLRSLIPDAGADEEFHVQLATSGVGESELGRAESWLLRLDRVNHDSGRYDPGAFQRELRRMWFYAHAHCASVGLRTLGSYWTSPLGGVRDIGLLRQLRLAAKSLFRNPGSAGRAVKPARE